MNTQPMASCVSRQEEGVRGEDALMVQRERGRWNTGCGHPALICLLLPAKEAGLPGAHSFNKYSLRGFFVLVCMLVALITQFLPLAIRSWQQTIQTTRFKWRGLGLFRDMDGIKRVAQERVRHLESNKNRKQLRPQA